MNEESNLVSMEGPEGPGVGGDVDQDSADPAAPPSRSASAAPDVFVSYRLDPDQQTATCLKRLIEGSIEPMPVVFVSGAGGLRPSSIGLRPQLQQAVTSARVFLAIITPQSKDREWVIFEAGAAWGRKQMYAPVLIDTEPHDLGTTIADFVATKADHRDQVETLVVEVAKALGSTVRKHFAQRYAAFERHLEQRSVKGTAKEVTAPDGTKLNQAMAFWQRGLKDEALKAFALAECEANTSEEKARVEILRLSLLHDDEPETFHMSLLRMKQEARTTAVWMLWKAITEPREHVAIADYDSVMEAASVGPSDKDFAAVYRASGLAVLGREREAIDFLMKCIATVSPDRRPQFVQHLLQTHSSISAPAKLMLAASALPYADSSLWTLLTELAIDERWSPIAVYAARQLRLKADTGTGMNYLGRAYLMAGCISLAYEAFDDAVKAGATVGKVNLALCLSEHPVPAAALAVLKSHVGDFDAAEPQFPCRVRADVEERIAKDRARADQLNQVGRRMMSMLVELADKGLASGGQRPAEVAVAEDGTTLELTTLYPFPSVFEARLGVLSWGLFIRVDSSGRILSGIRFDPVDGDLVSWTTLTTRGTLPEGIADDSPALPAPSN